MRSYIRRCLEGVPAYVFRAFSRHPLYFYNLSVWKLTATAHLLYTQTWQYIASRVMHLFMYVCISYDHVDWPDPKHASQIIGTVIQMIYWSTYSEIEIEVQAFAFTYTWYVRIVFVYDDGTRHNVIYICDTHTHIIVYTYLEEPIRNPVRCIAPFSTMR